MGAYYEIKRTDTGETVGHKLFDKDKTDPVLINVRKAMDQLFAACEMGNTKRVKQLATTGLDVRVRHEDVNYDHRRRGALHYAADKGQAETIQYLLELGCDPNGRDQEGVAPLHLAVCKAEAIDVLIKGKADPNVKDEAGRTALRYAVTEGSPGVAQVLLQHGAKVDLTDNVGSTPLFVAVEYGKADMVEVLLKAGAQPLAKNSQNQTPLDWARAGKHEQIVRKLQDAIESKTARPTSELKSCHPEGKP